MEGRGRSSRRQRRGGLRGGGGHEAATHPRRLREERCAGPHVQLIFQITCEYFYQLDLVTYKCRGTICFQIILHVLQLQELRRESPKTSPKGGASERREARCGDCAAGFGNPLPKGGPSEADTDLTSTGASFGNCCSGLLNYIVEIL